MSKGIFTYALLQYHHSQLLGEVLNVGLIAYFPLQKRLEFIYPGKLIRLRFAYPHVPEKTIKAYFKYFNKRVEELNTNPEIFSDYDLGTSLKVFLEREFLPSDSSSLQFGNFRTSVLYTLDLDHITNQLYNLYFSVFQSQENVAKRIDESSLLNKYKKLIKEFAHQSAAIKETNRFHFDYSIEPNSSSKIKFDVAWKDEDELHLVKPVSFDLSRPEIITRKAYQYYGQYLDLEDIAKEKDYLFDVIIAKPRSRSLFKTYENAIRLLEKPKRVNLIDQNELSSYSKATAESALL
ncbi:MAG: hypothetical protein ACO1NU_04055 [Arcticibacter sp.]